MKQQYDYIIAGAGCAGLSLLVRLLQSGKFNDKKILLIDKKPKRENDRTWCFWEKGEGFFESIVYRKWEKIWFHGKDFSSSFEILPYRYKMIRGEDFYEYCFSVIQEYPNIDIVWAEINEIGTTGESAWLVCGDEKIHAQYIFNSILFQKPVMGKGEYYLLQHFKGWVIETDEDYFTPAEATLMDFRVSQQHGASFVYTMPFSKKSALVEYTLFNDKLLKPDEYDEGLKNYIDHYLQIPNYKITEEEFGIIPMTNYPFKQVEGNIINIGTAGGYTKASSGYTFNFIQKASAQMVDSWIKNSFPSPAATASKKFHFYDSVFLRVLAEKQLAGADLFTQLFKKNDVQNIFCFLDNESTLQQDIGILASLPTWPFLKSALKHL